MKTMTVSLPLRNFTGTRIGRYGLALDRIPRLTSSKTWLIASFCPHRETFQLATKVEQDARA